MTQRAVASMTTWARRGAASLLTGLTLAIAWAGSATAQVGSPASYASLGTLNPAAGTYSLDTTAQTLTIGSTVYKGIVQTQPNGPNVVVFAFANVTIGDGVFINASGSQPFALLSQSNVTFSGTGRLNLSAVSTDTLNQRPPTPGPGGGIGGSNPGPGGGPGGGASSAPGSYTGGGGGGYGGQGGDGGDLFNNAGGKGGSTYGKPDFLPTTVFGGSGGGGADVRNNQAGGAGGGGVLIGAVGAINLTDRGSIAANGGAGYLGFGGGGGSGGGITLSGATVSTTGSTLLTANGGRGQDPSYFDGNNGSGGGGGGGGIITIRESTFNLGSLVGSATANGGVGAFDGTRTTRAASGSTGLTQIFADTSVVTSGQSLAIVNGKIGDYTLNSNTFNVQSGGVLTVSNGAQTVGTLTGSGTINLDGSALTVGVGDASGTFSGNITSDSSLTKTGAGTFTVAGSGRYRGVVAVDAGTLNVASNASIQAVGGFTNAAGAVVALSGTSATLSGGTFTNAVGGTLRGTGTISSNLANAGNVLVNGSNTLTFAGLSNVNSGTISLQSTAGSQQGEVLFIRALSNAASGRITGHGVLYIGLGGVSGPALTNLGSMSFSGATTDIYGLVQNGVGGSIISAGGGVLTFHDGLNFLAGSTIRTEAGSRTVVFGPTLLKGDFTGTGAVELAGTINIDPQIINFGGNLTLTSNTVFNMAVEGPGRGTGYDSLAVAGLATLAGTLNFLVSNGFVPTVGQQFLAVSYGSRSGVFGSIVANGLRTDEFLVADYRADGLYLTVASNAVPEPASLALLGLGVAGMLGVARARRRGASGVAG